MRFLPVLLLAAACTTGITASTRDNCRLVDTAVTNVQTAVAGLSSDADAVAKDSVAKEVQTDANTVGRLGDYEDEKVVQKHIRFVQQAIHAVAEVLPSADPAAAMTALTTATVALNTVCGI